jgi:hypothetical protein
VVLALFLIVGGLVLLYQNSETFREIWDKVWGKVKEVAKAFSEWFMREALPVIKDVLAQIGVGLTWLWENIFQPVFSMIWDIVKVVFKAISWWWENVLWPVFKGIGKTLWWLWESVFWPVLKKILKFWAGQIAAIKLAWDKVLKPVFKAIGDYLAGPMSRAWETFCDFLEDTWKWIQRTFADSVNVVIGILNGLSKAFNTIMESLGSDLRISMIGDVQWGYADTSDGRPKSKGGGTSTKGGSFDTGGWTGPGAKYDPVGTVHADEYVIKKESTNKLRRKFGLRWLDHLNNFGEVPGWAGGGLVEFGRRLQRMGYQVGQHPAFGRVGRHGKGSLHYAGRAIDVNADGRGQAHENAMLDALIPLARAAGFGMKWRAAGHFDHAHIDQGGSWKVGKERGPARGGGGGLASMLPDWMKNPIDWLKGKVTEPLS